MAEQHADVLWFVGVSLASGLSEILSATFSLVPKASASPAVSSHKAGEMHCVLLPPPALKTEHFRCFSLKFSFSILPRPLGVRGEHSIGESTERGVRYNVGSWFRNVALGFSGLDTASSQTACCEEILLCSVVWDRALTSKRAEGRWGVVPGCICLHNIMLFTTLCLK